MKRCAGYGIDKELAEFLRNLCHRQGIVWLDLNQSHLSMTLQEALQSESTEAIEAEAEKQVLIFEDLSQDEIYQMIDALRKAGFIYQGVMMGTTENNLNWTLRDCFEEVQKEHAYFKKLEQLKRCLTEANQLDLTVYTQESVKVYAESLMAGYMATQQEVEMEHLEQLLVQIQEAKSQLVTK